MLLFQFQSPLTHSNALFPYINCRRQTQSSATVHISGPEDGTCGGEQELPAVAVRALSLPTAGEGEGSLFLDR